MVGEKNRSLFKFSDSLFVDCIRSAIPLLIPCLLFLSSCDKAPAGGKTVSKYDKILEHANRVFDGGKEKEAVHYLDSATNHFKNLTLKQSFDYYNFNCNYYFHVKKDNAKSMDYADSMLNLFDTQQKRLAHITNYAQSLFYKGDVLFAENKYSEAYQYFYKGKLAAKKDFNQCVVGDYSYRMGMIMYKQEHYRLAAENFIASSSETGACEITFRSFYRRQELLDNTGLSYGKINEPDSALYYFRKTLAYINSASGQFNVRKELIDVARGVVYGNEANVYIRQKNYHLAKGLLEKSAQINLRKGNDNLDAELTEMRLGHLFLETNEIDSLYSILKTTRRQLDTIKNKGAEADWNLLMADYFIKQRRPGTALNYFMKYDALKDTIAANNKALKEADINQQIKQIEKDHDYNSLKKDNKMQNMYLKVIAAFGFMLLVIISLVLFNWRKSKKNVQVLGALNLRVKEQNGSLQSALAELKLSSEEKDRILRTVAHDLRNPIGGIASLTEAMADDGYTEEQKTMIDIIKETSSNSLELINEILEVANNGSTSFTREPVEINGLLKNSVELLRFKAAEKQQQIRLDLLPNPRELLISREKIWRVMSNLISNASKFSPVGGIIYVKAIEYSADVEISVQDNGIGIPGNMKGKIFNIFTEAKRPGTAGEKSFGLGLSISRQIIEGHLGRIWVESDGINGTTFYVRLPKG